MELKNLFIKLKYNYLLIGVFVIVGSIIGVIVYFVLPQKYLASGSFYVSRTTQQNVGDFFTYEGYYGQQTAQAYTATVIGLLESLDIKSKALSALGIPINEYTLRKYGKLISVKKSAPQLVTLNVKGNTAKQASDLWEAVSKNTLDTTYKLNLTSDPNLKISTLAEKPVIKETFWNIYANSFIGAGLGFLTGVGALYLFSYLKLK